MRAVLRLTDGLGWRLKRAISSARVRANAQVGRGFAAHGRVSISGGNPISIGDDVLMGDGVRLESDGGSLVIGHQVVLHDSVALSSSGRLSIGEGSVVNEHSVVRGDNIEIGRQVWVARHCTIEGSDVHIADRVIFGPYVHVNDSAHAIDPATHEILMHRGDSNPIRIGRNAWLGSGVMVLGGVTIGDGAIVGARSVVTKDVPAMCIAVGNPAKVVKNRITGERVDV